LVAGVGGLCIVLQSTAYITVKRRPLASVSTPAVGRSRAWAPVNEHLQAGEGALVHVILVPRTLVADPASPGERAVHMLLVVVILSSRHNTRASDPDTRASDREGECILFNEHLATVRSCNLRF